LRSIHSSTKSKVVFQICHAGPKALASPPPHFGPSQQANVEPLTIPQIDEIIQSFIKSSLWLKKAGADGVQLHAAHGFLLSAFLSPAYNRRTDSYGGSAANRVRLLSEIAAQIRIATGPDFLLSVKLNGNDHLPNGVTPELAAEYVRAVAPVVDLFEISAGAVPDRPFASRVNVNPRVVREVVRPAKEAERVIETIASWIEEVPFTEGYNLESARRVRKVVGENVKLAVCGGLRRFGQMEGIVKDGTVDVVSLSRPFLRQPDLVKVLKGEGRDADCIHCGLCQHAPRGTSGVNCLYPKV
jgi:2,4-dienoyl-CoA reductase-like NADH-dependent reductase (Old Yellow Enzyme family)